MKLGIPVYDGVDLLDVAGPYEMFSWVGKELEAVIVSADGGPVKTRRSVGGHNSVCFEAHASFRKTPTLDVLWVPGGDPKVLGKIMSDPESPYLDYLGRVAKKAKWVCSVCEGALLLARAGLLDGYQATTHWAFVECLKRFSKIEVDTTHQRYVLSGNRLTGGGISSGLDEALMLVQLLFGTKTALDVQLTTQYFPKPPVSASIPAAMPACPVHW